MVVLSDVAALKKYVDKMAKEAMVKGNSTKTEVIEEGKRHVQEDVYDVYSPTVYERTGQLKENWAVEETANGIAVYNTRRDEDTGKYIPDSIEYGRNYEYEFAYSNKPRPFIENTKQSLAKDDRLKNALAKDMRAIGLDVK